MMVWVSILTYRLNRGAAYVRGSKSARYQGLGAHVSIQRDPEAPAPKENP